MMHIVRLRACSAAMVGTITLCAATAGGSFIVIDDFTDTDSGFAWTETVASPGTQTSSVDSTVSVFGGSRLTTLTANAIGNPSLDFVQASLVPAAGVFDYRSTANATGSVSLVYGYDNTMSYDLSGQSSMNIDFVAFDFAGGQALPVTMTLFDEDDNAATQILSLSSAGPATMEFNFSDFSNLAMVDLTLITRIEIEFNAGEATDFRLSQIYTAVPAPGVLAVLAVAGLAGGRRRRCER